MGEEQVPWYRKCLVNGNINKVKAALLLLGRSTAIAVGGVCVVVKHSRSPLTPLVNLGLEPVKRAHQ
jgi:hypothetical protein